MAAAPVEVARARAMGCSLHVVVVGGPSGLARWACERVGDLERRWTRFRDDSELAALNRCAGEAVEVSPETFMVVSRAVAAWWATGGWFDPTVLRAVELAGYDRSYEHLGATVPLGQAAVVEVPGCAGIDLDAARSAVRLPAGVGLDLGGIGKGAAADIVVGEALGAGAAGVMVNIGGDLRAEGTAPDAHGWVVAVEDPRVPDRELARLALASGAVATSSRLARTWARPGGGRAHHLIDPAAGRPAAGAALAATVVAGEGWWAEALAKAALLAGPAEGPALLDGAGLPGLVVDDAGGTHPSAAWGRYCT
jgi:thiamine biosynthesis lipoprotein